MKNSIDLTTGSITPKLLWFAIPLIVGNLLQQFYNVADAIIVGQYLGVNALAAVDSSFTLKVFFTSVILGLCQGSGAVFLLQYSAKDWTGLKRIVVLS